MRALTSCQECSGLLKVACLNGTCSATPIKSPCVYLQQALGEVQLALGCPRNITADYLNPRSLIKCTAAFMWLQHFPGQLGSSAAAAFKPEGRSPASWEPAPAGPSRAALCCATAARGAGKPNAGAVAWLRVPAAQSRPRPRLRGCPGSGGHSCSPQFGRRQNVAAAFDSL